MRHFVFRWFVMAFAVFVAAPIVGIDYTGIGCLLGASLLLGIINAFVRPILLLLSIPLIWVKICGITNEPDANAAVEAGADALGFILVRRSKRYIDIEAAAGWIGKLPKNICKVAVMADPNWEDACRIGQLPFLDALQLHGSESAEFCRRL